ncbi:glycosyltransferase family 2 protein [Kineococcus sp. SYSU DK001]|uniref:glycosyltransferase n=1 Tax=Kineococcus sp. SYSU DK001 TaxID=3383122 RepID=UPI003D7E928F
MRICVVVPARDEEETIGDCLTSLDRAARQCPVPVEVVVVADRCVDGTADLARAAGVRVVTTRAGCVGSARRAGVTAALAGVPLSQQWIASTDADSRVPPQWLHHHAAAADSGVDLLLGVVRLDGVVTAHSRWRERYAAGEWTSGHRHVHGANLGVRASVYRAAGGFPPLPAHEDRVLAERVRELPGARVLTSTEFPVLASSRLLGRAPAELAHDLSA